MKTNCIYIGQNHDIKDKISLSKACGEMVHKIIPATALRYIYSKQNVDVVFWEIPDDTWHKYELVRFFKESLNKRVLLFLVVNDKDEQDKLLKAGADGVFDTGFDANKALTVDYLNQHQNEAISKRVAKKDYATFGQSLFELFKAN